MKETETGYSVLKYTPQMLNVRQHVDSTGTLSIRLSHAVHILGSYNEPTTLANIHKQPWKVYYECSRGASGL